MGESAACRNFSVVFLEQNMNHGIREEQTFPVRKTDLMNAGARVACIPRIDGVVSDHLDFVHCECGAAGQEQRLVRRAPLGGRTPREQAAGIDNEEFNERGNLRFSHVKRERFLLSGEIVKTKNRACLNTTSSSKII